MRALRFQLRLLPPGSGKTLVAPPLLGPPDRVPLPSKAIRTRITSEREGGVTVSIELRLLGTFAVQVDGTLVPDGAWRRRRAAEIVKILGLDPDHRLHREQIMEKLWPELAPDAAAANLRKAIHYARKALRSADAISTLGGVVELGPGTEVSVDSVRFEAAATAAVRSNDPVAAETAADLYVGDLLPEDRYEPWAVMPRERLRALAVRTLKCASRWEKVVEIDPADEEAHQALMQQALDDGDRARVVRQFQALSQRLRIDLGMGPDPRSVRLYERALAPGDEASSDAQRVRTLLARAFVRLNNGQLDLADESAAAARQLAIQRGQTAEFNEATALLSMVSSLRGRWRDLFRAEFAEAVQRPKDMAARVFDAHLCVTEYHVFGPDGHEGMLDYANGLRRIARASGSVQGEGIAAYLAGEAELFSGRTASAEQHLQAAAHLLEGVDATAGRVLALQRLADCAIAVDDDERARRVLLHGLRLARSSQLAPHLVIRMHEGLVRSSHGPSARSAVRVGESELAGELYCVPCSIGFRVAAAMTLADMGDADLAQKHLDHADEVAAMWRGGAWHAAVIEARGVLSRARGAEAEAVQLFVEAAGRYGALDRPIDETRCRFRATKVVSLHASAKPTRRRARAGIQRSSSTDDMSAAVRPAR